MTDQQSDDFSSEGGAVVPQSSPFAPPAPDDEVGGGWHQVPYPEVQQTVDDDEAEVYQAGPLDQDHGYRGEPSEAEQEVTASLPVVPADGQASWDTADAVQASPATPVPPPVAEEATQVVAVPEPEHGVESGSEAVASPILPSVPTWTAPSAEPLVDPPASSDAVVPGVDAEAAPETSVEPSAESSAASGAEAEPFAASASASASASAVSADSAEPVTAVPAAAELDAEAGPVAEAGDARPGVPEPGAARPGVPEPGVPDPTVASAGAAALPPLASSGPIPFSQVTAPRAASAPTPAQVEAADAEIFRSDAQVAAPALTDEEETLAAERAARRQARQAALAQSAAPVALAAPVTQVKVERRTNDKFAGALGLFLMRLVVAAIFGVRGVQMLIDNQLTLALFGKTVLPEPRLLGLVTGAASLLIALSLVLGLLTRAAGFGIAVIGAAALAFVYWGAGWSPFRENQFGFYGELELLLAAVGLLFVFVGAGGWSLDHSFRAARQRDKAVREAEQFS